MKLSVVIFSVMCAVMATSGCTLQQVETFRKYATLRSWDAYKTDVQYWQFKNGARVNVSSPTMFPAHVADNKSYVQFLINAGSFYVGLPAIYTDDIQTSVAIYKPYLQWAKLPFEVREQQKGVLNDSALFKEHRFTVQNELGSKEPLFIITRSTGYIGPDEQMAMTRNDIINMVFFAHAVKYAKDKGKDL